MWQGLGGRCEGERDDAGGGARGACTRGVQRGSPAAGPCIPRGEFRCGAAP